MEAAADVLLGMAAEKIQALVIHLCTSVHTHMHTHTLPPFAFSHSLSHFLTHTQMYTTFLSFFLSFINTLFPLSSHPPLALCNPHPILLSTAFIYFTSQAARLTFTEAAVAAVPHGIAHVLWWKEAQTCSDSEGSQIISHINKKTIKIIFLLSAL